MRAFLLCAVLLAGILAMSLPAQQPQQLDNQAIVKLHIAGLSDDTILHLINTEPGKYSTGVNDVIALKQAGICEKIIKALASKAYPAPTPTPRPVTGPASIPAGPTAPATPSQPVAPAAATPQPAAPAATAPQVAAPLVATPAAAGAQSPTYATPPPAQSIVYYAKDHQWVLLANETVNWRVGAGKLRAIASAGMVKRDVNGILNGASSATTLKAPPHFLLYATQNVAITQYYFVHLKPHADTREFLAVRQEDFEFKATRDMVPFESKEVESHWYLITLPAMEPGEYGIVPPEVAAAEHTAADPSKMYTFRLIP